MFIKKNVLAVALIAVASLAPAFAQQEIVVTQDDFKEEKVYSPYVGRAYPDQVLFGGSHSG